MWCSINSLGFGIGLFHILSHPCVRHSFKKTKSSASSRRTQSSLASPKSEVSGHAYVALAHVSLPVMEGISCHGSETPWVRWYGKLFGILLKIIQLGQEKGMYTSDRMETLPMILQFLFGEYLLCTMHQEHIVKNNCDSIILHSTQSSHDEDCFSSSRI